MGINWNKTKCIAKDILKFISPTIGTIDKVVTQDYKYKLKILTKNKSKYT